MSKRTAITGLTLSGSEDQMLAEELRHLHAQQLRVGLAVAALQAEELELMRDRKAFRREVFWRPVGIAVGLVASTAAATTLCLKLAAAL